MQLPLMPVIEPMLARLARTLPTGDFLYEPKWDGFRCIIFRDGDELFLQSRNGKPLDRYFPELIDPAGNDPLRASLPQRVVIDGELTVPVDSGLDFDALSARIHPAASRVTELAARTPASFVAFDLLALGDDDVTERPMRTRRDMLVEIVGHAQPQVHVTPATTDPAVAADWFARFEGAGLDGVIAKPVDDPYVPGARRLVKVKQERTAEVVVAGFRWHADGNGVGSLMLGLWDDEALVHVGVASSFSADRRAALVDELAASRTDPSTPHPWTAESDTSTTPRGTNRWNARRDTSWEPLDCTLVAEVAYDQLTGDRFRHSARFRRWRPDRSPDECGFAQLHVPPPAELSMLLGDRG